MNKDTGKYIDDINFEVDVYPGVKWVPLNTLGKTRYSNEDINEITKLPVEIRKNKISCLYEAVQLFQSCGFKGTYDNVDHYIDGIHWQTHKTCEAAVISNEGCCATDTNWLSYHIEGRYDKIGSLGWANPDGNGHIITCIMNSGKYYFIDMMMCRSDSQSFMCSENGNADELFSSEWSGFLFCCENPVDYCLFTVERFKAKRRIPPFAFYLRNTTQVTATGSLDNGSTFYIPNCDNPYLVWKINDDNYKMLFVELPQQLKN